MFYNIPHQATFYPKIYYKNNFYNENYKSASDHIYLMEYINTHGFSIEYIDHNISVYNNETGISSLKQDLLPV